MYTEIENTGSFLIDARDAITKTFAVKAATSASTAASRSRMESIFSTGLNKVLAGNVTSSSEKVQIANIRMFADQSPGDRVIAIRNLFLRALIITFPKINPDVAVTMASVKALLSYRESGGTVSWSLEGSTPFKGGHTEGWRNMNARQRYAGVVSGTGLIQWTADRQRNFLARMGSLPGNFGLELAFIDPSMQTLYWAAELAAVSGLSSKLLGTNQTDGIFFSDQFQKLLQDPNASCNAGEILGAFMLWQRGAGASSATLQNVVFGGKKSWLCYDLFKGMTLGLNGFYNHSDRATLQDIANGINKYARVHDGSYRPVQTRFYKDDKHIIDCEVNDDLLSKFNLK